MATTVIVSGIKPDLKILGNTQQFIFNQPTDSLQLLNLYQPQIDIPTNLNYDLLNFNNNGFRIGHYTQNSDLTGMFHLSLLQYQQNQINSGLVSTKLMTFNENSSDNFMFYKAINLDNNKIINLATPTTDTDAVNKNYVDNKIFDINTNTSGQLNINRLNGYPANSSLFLNGNGAWENPRQFTTNALSVTNAGGFIVNNTNPAATAAGLIVQNNSTLAAQFGFNNSTNEAYVWANGTATLKFGTAGIKRLDIAGNSGKTSFYDPSYNCYIRPASNYLDMRGLNVYNSITSTIIETNANSETSSIVMNGDFMQFINPMDTLGFIFTDEDNTSMTSYVAYINSSGQIVPCSKDKKHSIRKKEHKDYLQRLNKLSLYSYGLKYQINKSDSAKKRIRKQIKMNELQVGVIAEEVAEIFDNATNQYKPLDLSKKEKPSHTPSLGVNYNTILCYTILAVQELTKKVEVLESKLNNL